MSETIPFNDAANVMVIRHGPLGAEAIITFAFLALLLIIFLWLIWKKS